MAATVIDAPRRSGPAPAGPTERHDAEASAHSDSRWGREGVSSWDRFAAHLPIAAVTVTALLLNCWDLSVNGLGNQYYAAATRSMATSWSNFFFASFDPGGFISVDKPPVSLWVTAASARIFGVNSWSLLLPSALAGAGAVALLFCTVRRYFGVTAATIAGLVLALSPVSVAVNRLNLPEPFMVMLLVATAWAVLRSFDASHPMRWVVLAGVLVGLAFNTKMLAAFVPLPAIGIALLVGTPGWRARVTRAVAFAVTTLVVSFSWLTVVDLTPPSTRPYVGGSTDDTVLDLLFGYNGLGRVSGGGMPGGGGPGGGTMGAAGGVFGGSAGPSRLFSDALGGQIAWLLPLAATGAIAAAWLCRRDRSRRAAIVLWLGWLALYGVVFSYASGTLHAYYTSAMAPAVAAVVGMGAAAMVALLRRSRWWFVLLGVGVGATVSVQVGLAGRAQGFYSWVVPLAAAAVAAAVALLAVAHVRRQGRLVSAGLALGMAGLLMLPAAWSVSETTNPVLNATLPQAGPRTGASSRTFGAASFNGDKALSAYLESEKHGETWDLAVTSAQTGSGLIAYDGLSVMALGGFMGSDQVTDVEEIAELVESGQVRFFLPSGAMGGAPGTGRPGAGAGPGMAGGTASQIMDAVRQSCTAVTAASSNGSLPASYSGALYDCAGRADRLREAASLPSVAPGR